MRSTKERPLSSAKGNGLYKKQLNTNSRSQIGCQEVNVQDAAIELLSHRHPVTPVNPDRESQSLNTKHKGGTMSRNFEDVKIEGVDRIEGDTIIMHDFYPKGHRVLKWVKIITAEGVHIRRIKKTNKGGYLFN